MFGKLLNKGKKEEKEKDKEKDRAAKAASPSKSASSSKASAAKKPPTDSKSTSSGSKKTAGAPKGGPSSSSGTSGTSGSSGSRSKPSSNPSISINGNGTFHQEGVNQSLSIDSLSLDAAATAATAGGHAASGSASASPGEKTRGLRTPPRASPAKPTGSAGGESESPGAPGAGPEGARAPLVRSSESAPEPPEEFVCPLSLEMMFDPVIVSSGQTYERAFILRWLEEGHASCPKTRQPLDPNSIFPNQVVKMMIADWCSENGVPLPTAPKVVSLVLGPAGAVAPVAGQDAAARARALALESQRRQRHMMEHLAAQRQRVPSRRRGQPPPAIPEGEGGEGDGGPSATPSTTPSTAGGTAGGSIGGDARLSRVSSNQIGVVERQRSGTRGDAVASSAGATDAGSNSMAHSMSSIAHSFVSDSASWPGPLAMQSAIFQTIFQTNNAPGSFSVGGGDAGSASASSSSASEHSGRATQGSPAPRGDSGTGAGEAPAPEGKVPPGALGPPRRAHPAPQSLQNLPAGGAGFSGSFPQRLTQSGTFEPGSSLPGSVSVDSMWEAQREASSAPDVKMPDVTDLVANLSSEALEEQAAAVALLRVLTRFGARQAKRVARAGAIEPLVRLMRAEDAPTVEHAVTTLLNISLNEDTKPLVIKDANVIPSMVHVLTTGMPQARANAAAAMYLLSTLEGVREELPAAGAVPALVELLLEGNAGGKKDAANCLLSICLHKDNRREVAESGVIRVMCGLLAEGENMVEEQTAGVCASLVRDPEGRNLLFEEGAITALAELVEAGETARTKEYGVNALLGLAVHSKACLAAIDDEGITASIDVMTRTGSTKTQAKATALLELLRRHGEGEE